MGLAHSPRIVTDGLVFAYDMNNTQKSWKGAPTTNLITNPLPGGTTTGYVSAGGTGTTTYDSVNQAIKWVRTTYETWGAYHYVSPQFNGNLNISTPYTISFEWRTEGNVFNNSVYSYNLVQGNGLEIAGSAVLLPNSTLQSNGWYLFKYTFTPANTGVTAFNRIVLPSQGTNVSTFYWRKIQFEQRSFASPFVNGTRTNTQSIIDLTGNNTATVADLTYAADNTFSFDGVNDYVSISAAAPSTANPVTLNVIFNLSANGFNGPSSNPIISWGYLRIYGRNTTNEIYVRSDASIAYNAGVITLGTNNFNTIHICGTYSGWNGSSYTMAMYVNGNFLSQAVVTEQSTNNFGYFLGGGSGGILNGRINYAAVYNRVLTAQEIRQNFEAYRGRFGL